MALGRQKKAWASGKASSVCCTRLGCLAQAALLCELGTLACRVGHSCSCSVCWESSPSCALCTAGLSLSHHSRVLELLPTVLLVRVTKSCDGLAQHRLVPVLLSGLLDSWNKPWMLPLLLHNATSIESMALRSS